MSVKNYIFFGLLAVIFVKPIDGHQKCRTPSGPVGYCVPFNACEKFNKLEEQQWFTPTDLDLIEKSWCGRLNGIETICCPIGSTNVNNELHLILSRDSEPPKPTISDLTKHPNAKLLPIERCGKSSSDKIVKGNLTAPFEFPWMAMLRTISKNELHVFCGGTLISSRYVLTAAHCLRTVQGEIPIHSVVLGEHDITKNPDCIDATDCADPIQEIPVERSIPHPNFTSANAKNDIGLVRLKWNAMISDSVLPICVPYTDESKNLDFTKIIVSGWGGTENGPTSNVLLKAILNITPNSECSTTYKQHYYNRLQIDDNFMCAYGGESDTCSGDSGGPAIFFTSIPRFGPRMFQYGIVSAGARTCGQNIGIPGLYTRVTRYVQWILDNISE